MNHRAERVSSLIRRELSKIILKEMDFPAGALVTITGVETDGKLERAKVKVSVLPPSFSVAVMKSLDKDAGRLQHLLLKKINIKPMPKIFFELDRGPENASVVEKLLIKDNNR